MGISMTMSDGKTEYIDEDGDEFKYILEHNPKLKAWWATREQELRTGKSVWTGRAQNKFWDEMKKIFESRHELAKLKQ